MRFFKISVVIIFCLFFHKIAIAQIKSLKELPLNISYFGHELVFPGMKVGTDIHFLKWEKERRKNTIYKSLFVSPQIAFNTHFHNHFALLLNIEVGLQRKYAKGFFIAYSLGFGDLIQLNWGTTYELQSDGSIQEKKLASHSYFLPSFNLQIGKEINSKLAIFGKASAAAKTNYNTFALLPQFYWDLGVKISL